MSLFSNFLSFHSDSLIIVSAVNVEKSMFAGDGDEEDTSMAEDVCPDLSHIIRSLDTPPPSS